MTAMAKRRGAILALLSVNLILLSCSTSSAPQPGTPGFYWGAAKETFKAADYQKTAEHLNNILSSDNEYVARAQPWFLILTSGMVRGDMDLATAYEAGGKAFPPQATNFHRQVNQYQSDANTLALQFAETFAKFDTKGADAVTLSFAYPTGSPTEPVLLSKISGGNWPTEANLATVQKDMIERGVLLATCRAAGAPDDPAKVLELLKTGDAKIPRATFIQAMAAALYDQSQLYVRSRMDQPDRLKIFCDRAEAALKLVPPSKETQDLEKKIQAAMKRPKG